MAFPDIPTGGRAVTGKQADTTGTRTFPSLTGLTKNAGDLLLAICVSYGSNTGGATTCFSSWGASFTEFYDNVPNSTSMAIGVAYKWSDGTETGTFTVTQAATVTGHAVFILLSIAGAHATTAPEAGSRADGTTTTADPAAFNPTGWDAEDTLWIALGGSGETSTTGAYTGISGTPTNYGNAVDTTATGDVVGACQAIASFRQLNAASEDVGTYTVDTSNARNAAVVIAVRPTPPTIPNVIYARGQGAWV